MLNKTFLKFSSFEKADDMLHLCWKDRKTNVMEDVSGF